MAFDFQKAVGSVTHHCIGDALSSQGVEPSYVKLLQNLYRDQTASVKTDKVSTPFNIQTGTKQGDPLSSLLFNSVSEHIMGQIQLNWKRKGMGVQLLSTSETRLTNLRFADDLISLVHSLSHVSTMIEDLCLAARQIGLELHPKKTVILHNAHCNKRTEGDAGSFP